jgi:hypothetical protein
VDERVSLGLDGSLQWPELAPSPGVAGQRLERKQELLPAPPGCIMVTSPVL